MNDLELIPGMSDLIFAASIVYLISVTVYLTSMLLMRVLRVMIAAWGVRVDHE